MESVFDKNLNERKHLIVVNGPSAAGTMKVARWYMKDADNIGLVYIDFAFDAYTFPKEYTEPAIRAINKECDFKEWPWLTDVFCEFLKVDLNNFERITVWHGNHASDLMFLYFFADYYGKPFYVMDIAKHVELPKVVDPAALRPKDLAGLCGKERLLTQEEVDDLRLKAQSLRINDTGYHRLNKDGHVTNILPEEFTEAYKAVIEDNGGEIWLSRMIGQLLSKEMQYCSLDLLEKVLIYLLRKGTLKGFWKIDNTPIPPDNCCIDFVQCPDPKEFCFQNVIIRSK